MVVRKFPKQAPEMPLYLAIPRDEAERKIAERIQRGRDHIRDPAIRTKDELNALQQVYLTWHEYNEEMLRRMFTSSKIADEYNPSTSHFFSSLDEQPLSHEIKYFHDRVEVAIRRLASIKDRLELIPLAPGVGQAQVASKTAAPTVNIDKLFIVHGHDDAAREAVARFVSKFDLNPLILHEQANKGRTIVEKLEQHGDVGFAIVLLTPDDVGGINSSQLQPRARQNVVLELGYFMGRLGRQNVCALYRGELELPSDYMGVIYIPFDSGGGWRLQLAKELKAAGFPIDMNKAI